jgi:hypothetical protein
MRTHEEIVNKIHDRIKKNVFFDFFPDVLIPYLPFDDARPFLNQEALKSNGVDNLRSVWVPSALSREEILKEAKEYMEFAWGKVQDHRGLSANRSIHKMEAYCWLLGDEDKIDWSDKKYPMYGAPILKQVSELYGFPIPDDVETVRMMNGKPCNSECVGCK